jgi:DNA-binding Lrp family transcriptional regulator
MVNAIVLLSVKRGRVKEIAEQLVEVPGVSEVHSVAGRYDLVAILRVKNNEDLADIVTERIQALDGIERSETLIGFRVYSRHDLEHLFSVGLE